MSYFYKYVDPSTLLVSSDKDAANNLNESENSKLVSGDEAKDKTGTYTSQLDHYENGKASPSPRRDPAPEGSDYESEF